MQTFPVNSKHTHQALQPVPVTNTNMEPLPFPLLPSGERQAQRVSASQPAHLDPHAELDAMLIRDPNVGAVHGLRFALLFNAGVALSGLVIWELWAFLAS